MDRIRESRVLVRFCHSKTKHFVELMETPKDEWEIKLMQIFRNDPDWMMEEMLAIPRERVVEEILFTSVTAGLNDVEEIFRLWGGELSTIKYGKYCFLQRVFYCFSKIILRDSHYNAFRIAMNYYNGEDFVFRFGDDKISSIIQEWNNRMDVKEPDLF